MITDNLELEQAVIGAIVLNNNLYFNITFLEPRHFNFDQHQKIFEEIEKRIINNERADNTTLKPFLLNNNIEDYMLKACLQNAALVISLFEYAKEIIKLWQLRETKLLLKSILMGEIGDFKQIKDKLEDKLASLSETSFKEPKKIDKIIDDVLSTSQEQLVYSDFCNLDDITGGFELGNLVILGGRASSGKTTFCLNLAKRVSALNGVLFFSMEVSSNSLARKFLNELTGASAYRIKTNSMNESDLRAIEMDRHKFKNYQLFIDQENGLTIAGIRNKVNKYIEKYNIKMICIDYLQLIQSGGKEFSREQQISRIAEGLKKIAKDFNIVVIALSQLSRAGDTRENKRPVLSDLRDSGAIEQNADLVIFVHRDEYFLEREKLPENHPKYNDWLRDYQNSKGRAEIIVAKNREGQCGNVAFAFDGSQSQFKELKK
jgi:replicative DNA helicase